MVYIPYSGKLLWEKLQELVENKIFATRETKKKSIVDCSLVSQKDAKLQGETFLQIATSNWPRIVSL